MVRKMLVGVAGAVLILVGLIPAAGAATTITLLVPQGTAFAVLGRSCGGIQEQVLATGFDPVSGYPTGAAYLQTRCGGSGRGGGYHTTTYSAWTNVTWDFTGAVISYAVGSAPANLDPAFSATDVNGNVVRNVLSATNVLPANCTVGNTTYCGYRAYLDRSDTFVPPPRVVGISSSAGPAAGGTSVTITGTGFTGATGVTFGGVAAASFVVNGDGSITVSSPAAGAGTVDVTVTNAGGTSATSPSDQFTFVAAPSVSDVSPNTGPIAGGTSVEITGTGFTDATSVSFGGVATDFAVNDDSSITAISPTAEDGGPVDVTVTSLGGTSATSAADQFNYIGVPAPVVTKLNPGSGSAGGNTKVTIKGRNFLGATEVDFGGVPALSFTVNAAGTSIAAVAPPSTSIGVVAVDVVVIGPGGESPIVTTDVYRYVAPVVTKVTPAAGSAGGGTKVTIAGKYLFGAIDVSFGGIPAVSFTVNAKGTSITAIAPPDSGSGGLPVDVSVTTLAGTGTRAAAFTYL